MHKTFESIVEVFSSLKNKNIRFNPQPWKSSETVASSTNVKTSNETFVDLHMEVAKKVDALIADMENEDSLDFPNGNVKSTLKI